MLFVAVQVLSPICNVYRFVICKCTNKNGEEEEVIWEKCGGKVWDG